MIGTIIARRKSVAAAAVAASLANRRPPSSLLRSRTHHARGHAAASVAIPTPSRSRTPSSSSSMSPSFPRSRTLPPPRIRNSGRTSGPSFSSHHRPRAFDRCGRRPTSSLSSPPSPAVRGARPFASAAIRDDDESDVGDLAASSSSSSSSLSPGKIDPGRDDDDDWIRGYPPRELLRLRSLRNVGVFAHVDAGKTTVTERMLALAGAVSDPGSVDSGDTVTDYLPAERERGITIQSAAVGFSWVVPNGGARSEEAGIIPKVPSKVDINLIDTPGHVDFSVEVHRSVAVLDGAVLVVDAVAGVQAQTETVWRAMRNEEQQRGKRAERHGRWHGHEPLPALLMINKMDREGADFFHALDTVRRKLRGSNPVAVQLPLYRTEEGAAGESEFRAPTARDSHPPPGAFVGVIDLVHRRALVYPSNAGALRVEDAVPTVVDLAKSAAAASDREWLRAIESAAEARTDLVAALAEVDEAMEDLYLLAIDEEESSDDGMASIVSADEMTAALRRATLGRKISAAYCGAALRGIGTEPLLDGVAMYLPSPMDRLPPALSTLGGPSSPNRSRGKSGIDERRSDVASAEVPMLGHPLHPFTLAFVFKVLHMKGRGGSGDGRVAYARVYSGKLKPKDAVRVISPTPLLGGGDDADKNDSSSDRLGGSGGIGNGGKGGAALKKKSKFPVERIGGMLELAGGRFDNLEEGECLSGEVCALVGLKKVVTGDTLLLQSVESNKKGVDKKGKNKNNKARNGNDGGSSHWRDYMEGVCLAGVSSPNPVLTVRVEAMSTNEQTRLSSALSLLVVEDPSLVVEETPTTTLLSGLGELHIEVVLDRIRREHGLQVRTGKPKVTYRETITEVMETGGLVNYDRMVGGTKLQGAVSLRLDPVSPSMNGIGENGSRCAPPEEPTVTIGPEVRKYLGLDLDMPEDELAYRSAAVRALLSGCRGSLKRGRVGPYPIANVSCHILDIDSEAGPGALESLPGAIRAASANAISTLLFGNSSSLAVLEPKMSVEIYVPQAKVGDVLSDLTVRRGIVDDVILGDSYDGGGGEHIKALVHAEVPLVEILGYATSLRSLTGGEGTFSAEYKGHAPSDGL